jgi:hypothetical protein
LESACLRSEIGTRKFSIIMKAHDICERQQVANVLSIQYRAVLETTSAFYLRLCHGDFIAMENGHGCLLFRIGFVSKWTQQFHTGRLSIKHALPYDTAYHQINSKQTGTGLCRITPVKIASTAFRADPISSIGAAALHVTASLSPWHLSLRSSSVPHIGFAPAAAPAVVDVSAAAVAVVAVVVVAKMIARCPRM